MDNRRTKQRGSVTVLAIVAMLFLGTIIAGLLPMLTIKHGAGNADRDTMAARYAAEAGLKRAYAAISDHSDQWNWLSTQALVQNIPLWDDSTTTYSVSISPASPALATGYVPSQGTYTITSTGMVNGQYQQQVTGVIVVLADGQVQFPGDPNTYGRTHPVSPTDPGEGVAVFPGPVNDPEYINATKYGILSGGTLTVYNGNYTNPTYGNEYALATTAGAPGFPWGPEVTTSVTQVLLDMFEAGFFNADNSRLDTFTKHPLNETINPGVQGLAWNNIWTVPVFPSGKQMYEVSGDVVFNLNAKKGDILTTGAFPNQVVIYSHGNIIVNTAMQGNFVLIADGTITLNGNNTDTGQIELYAQGNVTVDHRIGTIARPATSYGVFMTRSTLTVHGDCYNKAFMFGRSSVTYDGGGTMYGAMYSLGNITISSPLTFVYDPSVIP
ncbi:hypothetical protein [Anaeroselena agilis]|uniref:Type 4 fimbrial biogenesis protein PilX N-terminal domain-containing protein n=1 Tax=Anaeroselena agilis TaxID=3063788 RepID=A0ABU3NYL5_9FIRM|nr:hypothetical protein [Selenomonadales bacterium 4137-cl]